jgi:hypothetical protein
MNKYIYVKRKPLLFEISFADHLDEDPIIDSRDCVYYRIYETSRENYIHMLETYTGEGNGDKMEEHIENTCQLIFDSITAEDSNPLDPYHIKRKIEKKKMLLTEPKDMLQGLSEIVQSKGLKEELVLDFLADVHIEVANNIQDPFYEIEDGYDTFYEILFKWVVRDKMKEGYSYHDAVDIVEEVLEEDGYIFQG